MCMSWMKDVVMVISIKIEVGCEAQSTTSRCQEPSDCQCRETVHSRPRTSAS